jgi:hypothetical protein
MSRTATATPVSGDSFLLSCLQPETQLLLKPTLDWWAPTGSLTQMMLAMKADRATQRKLRRITNGQASDAVKYQKLIESLIDAGEWETVELFAKAMQGDRDSLQAVHDSELGIEGYQEFIAILGNIAKRKQALAAIHLQDSLTGTESVPPVQRPRTKAKSERLPRQVLSGAVVVRAPSCLPTDVTHMGYAVGLVA